VKLFVLASVLTLTLSGCVASSPIVTQNGTPGHAINCSASNMAQCYKKAGMLCGPSGYNILNQKDDESFWHGNDKRMIVECK